MADKQYQALLFQHARVHTETFDIEAKDEKAAKAEAEKFVREQKNVTDKWEIEIKEAAGAPQEDTSGPAPEPEVR